MNHPFPMLQVGEYQLTALSDGNLSANLKLLSGIDQNDAISLQNNADIKEYHDIHINCYLIQGCQRTILVDTGLGAGEHRAGQLMSNLAKVGLTADDIDTILLTHCHPDHIGGLLDDNKKPIFKQALIVLHPLEAHYWRSAEHLHVDNERLQRNHHLVCETLLAYSDRIRFFTEDYVVPGILPLLLPGHTPGHTGLWIEGASHSVVIWGDIVHYPMIQSVRPAVSISFDANPLLAEKTRLAIMDRVVNEKLIIAGMHLGDKGFATLIKEGEGYRMNYLI